MHYLGTTQTQLGGLGDAVSSPSANAFLLHHAQVIAAVQVFFFEGPGRKLSRLQQLAAALFLSFSRCSRRPIIIKRIDQLAFSNAVKQFFNYNYW